MKKSGDISQKAEIESRKDKTSEYGERTEDQGEEGRESRKILRTERLDFRLKAQRVPGT